MSSQIFKNKIPSEKIFELLENISCKNEKYFIVNNDVYKRGMYNETIPVFFEECKPYYHISKRKYLERKTNYNSFITILRQICNFNKITYTSQIKYDKSNYDIVYYIYF
jgi:lysyl-tRNA synthetase class I